MNERRRRGWRLLARIVLACFLITAAATTWIVQTSGDEAFAFRLDAQLINDITGLNPIRVGKVVAPKSVEEIVRAIRETSGPVSIGGGRYSQGGQIAYAESLHLDMRDFDAVLHLDPEAKEITVQSGITWRAIQEAIDPHDLSVRIMQTYANFTVGGSLSVNVHGRYIGEGPLVKSVKSIKLALADGSIVEAGPDRNSEFFYGAIGGYGGLGVIVEARLALAENDRIERIATPMPIESYRRHFFENIRNHPDVVFHNADIYPPRYESVRDVSWYRTNKAPTIEDRLIPTDTEYVWQPHAVELVAGSGFGKWLRERVIDPLYYSFDRVAWRNWEASYDVRELEPGSRDGQTYGLREYFVPVDRFDSFVARMRDIFQRHGANIINVSVRHAHPDPGTLLAWAREEVFAFVVYYRQGTDAESRERVKEWSLEMIDAALAEGGTYYLPYQILASPEQFSAAYPRSAEFFALKSRVDPDYRFRNQLWKHHYPAESTLAEADPRTDIKGYFRGEEQTFLTIPEWYLVFNPREYADYLDAGHDPGDFPFMASIEEYWTLYDRARAICEHAYPDNAEYLTMLRVIGISTTVEYLLKGAYEKTVGQLTRWTAGGRDTPEEALMRQAYRAYSDLIFDRAWYEFEFWSWVRRLWTEAPVLGPDLLRKLERRLFFTVEFGLKAAYAGAVGFAANAAYEEGDGLIYMLARVPQPVVDSLPEAVTRLGRRGDAYLLAIPRWGAFTRTLPRLAERGVEFEEIAGNRRIALSLLVPSDGDGRLDHATPLFDSRLASDPLLKRRLVLVRTEDLREALAEIALRGATLEHVYDY